MQEVERTLEYTIVDGSSEQAVIDTVNDHLATGWLPLNCSLAIQMVVLNNKIFTLYAQTLVRDVIQK